MREHTEVQEATPTADPASYETWNEALAGYFFGSGSSGQPVYLQVDRDTLREIGPQAGAETEQAEQVFIQAVRSKLLPGKINPFSKIMSDARIWRWRVKNDPQMPPPFVALLGASVLAASRMAGDPDKHISGGNYYARLNDLLGLDYEGKPNGFEEVTNFWRTLAWWLEEVNGGDLGMPTARTHNFFRYVGYPISQSLLRDADRRKLPDFFRWADLAPGEDAEADELVPLIKTWALRSTCTLNERSRALFTKGSSTLVHHAAEIVAAELKAWDGVSVNAEGQASAGIDLHIRVLKGGHLLKCQLYPRAPDRFPEGLYESGSISIELTRLRIQRWFRPLPEALVGEALGQGLILRSGRHVLRFHYAHVIPLRHDEDLGGWVSCQRINIGEQHLVLCHRAYEAQVTQYLTAYAEVGWKQLPGFGLPDHWRCFTNVRVNTSAGGSVEELDRLVPRLRVGIRLQGGLKVDGDTWLKGGEPLALIAVREGQPVTVRIDGQEAKHLPAGNGEVALAELNLSSGEHEIEAGPQRRRFQICTPGYCAIRRSGAESLGQLLLRDRDEFIPLSLTPGDLPPTEEQQPGQLRIVGARVLGLPQDVPAPLQESLVLPRGSRCYVVLGKRPGEITEHRPKFGAPYWYLKGSGALIGKFELAVPFEPQWLIKVGTDRREQLVHIGAMEPPREDVADESQLGNWVRWSKRHYRKLKGQKKAALWEQYRALADKLSGGQ